jgi:hypothetical protein
MVHKMTAKSLPPLDQLHSLFHYNPLTGAITYLQQRGPRTAGKPAGATIRGIPSLYVAGAYHSAAAVAWALHHGADPSPQHVTPADSDPLNLKINNLRLADEKFIRQRVRRKPARRFIGHKKHIRYSSSLGMWQAWHNYKLLGLFYSKTEASIAKLNAMKADREPVDA